MERVHRSYYYCFYVYPFVAPKFSNEKMEGPATTGSFAKRRPPRIENNFGRRDWNMDLAHQSRPRLDGRRSFRATWSRSITTCASALHLQCIWIASAVHLQCICRCQNNASIRGEETMPFWTFEFWVRKKGSGKEQLSLGESIFVFLWWPIEIRQ